MTATPVARPSASAPEPAWLPLARAEIGTREIKGAKDNARILSYRKSARCSWVAGSEEAVAWCAVFVNAMLEDTGVRGTASPAAKSFCASRGFVQLRQPAAGAVTVIERNPPHPSLGHVAFLVGSDAEFVWLLGGNQGDAVNVSRFARARVKGFYWPADVALPPIGDVAYAGPAAAGGSVV